MMMKKIVIMAIGLLFFCCSVTAYQVNIDAPDTLAVGKPLVVTGTTTFGIGTPIDVVLYRQLTTATEVQRKIAYIQSDKSFKAVFDTTGLKKGTYKVEVPTNGLGDSFTMRVVNLVDRSEDLFLSSSATQPYTGKIFIAGEIKGDENSGVQIEVADTESNVIFGPRYVNTNYQGSFSLEVPITKPGDYMISFTDGRGYVGERTITSVGDSVTIGAPTTSPTAPRVVSAHTKASQDNPAYFGIKGGYGVVVLSTSSSSDWVIEYVDDRGIIQTVNNQGDQKPESVTLTGKGKPMYVKIYPYKSTVNSEVFLYASNASSVAVNAGPPAPFAASIPQPPPETQAPVFPALSCVAVGIVWALYRYP